ncbi:amidase family protein [Prescottella equi]|uniref:amidase family protein n=1 Tax=Rhodococcus hoagii TaxID=43767 RepID=UPI0033070AD7
MQRQPAVSVVGQTNSPAFGFRGTTDNYTVGPTRNPFCLDRNPRGSPGGSAAAVQPEWSRWRAHDGGGSIRIPPLGAGWSGSSHRQARLLSWPGQTPSEPPASSMKAPITRTVEDSALAMTALHGFDPRRPIGSTEP